MRAAKSLVRTWEEVSRYIKGMRMKETHRLFKFSSEVGSVAKKDGGNHTFS